MLLKVCGVSGAGARRDVGTLAGAGADLVGLWHGVSGGRADLTASELVGLAAAARADGIEPVLVTFARDAAALSGVLRAAGVTWVQLHGYQLPAVVRALRGGPAGLELTIVKVLHVRGDRCVDLGLARAYERAGVDAFLLDVATEDGRVGSTGRRMPPDIAVRVADELRRPFLLAGGIAADGPGRYAELRRSERFAGIDVDTGARDGDGCLAPRRIAAIDRAWRGHGPRERDVLLR